MKKIILTGQPQAAAGKDFPKIIYLINKKTKYPKSSN